MQTRYRKRLFFRTIGRELTQFPIKNKIHNAIEALYYILRFINLYTQIFRRQIAAQKDCFYCITYLNKRFVHRVIVMSTAELIDPSLRRAN